MEKYKKYLPNPLLHLPGGRSVPHIFFRQLLRLGFAAPCFPNASYTSAHVIIRTSCVLHSLGFYPNKKGRSLTPAAGLPSLWKGVFVTILNYAI